MSFLSLGANPLADPTFPKLDAFHNHCSLTVTFEKSSCQHAFNTMKDDAMLWHPDENKSSSFAIWHAVEEE